MSTVSILPDGVVFRTVVVRDARTNKARSADIAPTGVLYRNGQATTVPVTITELSGPNSFLISFPVPSDAVVGDAWEVLVSATVDGQVYQRWLFIAQTILPNGTVYRGFTTRRQNRIAQEPDALPTAEIFTNGVLSTVSVTISQVGPANDGNFMLSFPVASV